jgi:hypothetical protein
MMVTALAIYRIPFSENNYLGFIDNNLFLGGGEFFE